MAWSKVYASKRSLPQAPNKHQRGEENEKKGRMVYRQVKGETGRERSLCGGGGRLGCGSLVFRLADVLAPVLAVDILEVVPARPDIVDRARGGPRLRQVVVLTKLRNTPDQTLACKEVSSRKKRLP